MCGETLPVLNPACLFDDGAPVLSRVKARNMIHSDEMTSNHGSVEYYEAYIQVI